MEATIAQGTGPHMDLQKAETVAEALVGYLETAEAWGTAVPYKEMPAVVVVEAGVQGLVVPPVLGVVLAQRHCRKAQFVKPHKVIFLNLRDQNIELFASFSAPVVWLCLDGCPQAIVRLSSQSILQESHSSISKKVCFYKVWDQFGYSSQRLLHGIPSGLTRPPTCVKTLKKAVTPEAALMD